MKIKFLFAILFALFICTSCGWFTKSIQKKVLKEIGIDDEKRARLMKDGKKSGATILRVEDTNTTLNNNPQVIIYLKVKPEKEEEFEAKVETYVSRVRITRKGNNVTVYYNPQDKTDIIVE